MELIWFMVETYAIMKEIQPSFTSQIIVVYITRDQYINVQKVLPSQVGVKLILIAPWKH